MRLHISHHTLLQIKNHSMGLKSQSRIKISLFPNILHMQMHKVFSLHYPCKLLLKGLRLRKILFSAHVKDVSIFAWKTVHSGPTGLHVIRTCSNILHLKTISLLWKHRPFLIHCVITHSSQWNLEKIYQSTYLHSL